MTALVSILMPAYNAERWIAESLQSALAQTWPRIEIIVVDDGSSDGTTEIVRSFNAPNVKLIKQSNSGPCVARNAAFELAQGDVIQWLDADDILDSRKIEWQMSRLAGQDWGQTVLSSACATFRHDIADARFEATAIWQDLSPKDVLIRKFTRNLHHVIHAWLIPRPIAERTGPWDVRLQKTDADGEYSSRMVAACGAVLFVPEARCYYRKGLQGSLSATRTYIEQEELLLKLLFQHLLSIEDSEQARDACMTWLKTWAGHYYQNDRRAIDVFNSVSAFLDRSASDIPLPLKFRIAESVFGWEGARSLKQWLQGRRASTNSTRT